MNSHQEQLQYLYLGILNNYPTFAEEADAHLTYDFAAPAWEELRSRYALSRIAGTGSSFEKARRLTHYLAPRLTHCSFYDNHVECNSLQLLAYSLDNAEHGINCLNKAKILAECCLALGIYARRVFIQPFSPFDFDSHVVCEIFDEERNRWIMLDPTTDGYFVDESFTPLSMTDIRQGFLTSRFPTFVSSARKGKDLPRTTKRAEDIRLYFLKNCFRLSFEPYNGFGKKGGSVCLLPKNYSVCKNEQRNHRFRVEHMPEAYRHLLDAQEEYLKDVNHTEEPVACTVSSLYASPGAGARE